MGVYNVKMKLWVSRTEGWDHYDFWTEEPTVWWSKGKPLIGLLQLNGPTHLTSIWDLHTLLPKLHVPFGEYIVIEVVELENGYYIGEVKDDLSET
jgi:hypothetical protein